MMFLRIDRLPVELPASPEVEFVGAPPSGGNLVNLAGIASSFAPEEIFEIAN